MRRMVCAHSVLEALITPFTVAGLRTAVELRSGSCVLELAPWHRLPGSVWECGRRCAQRASGQRPTPPSWPAHVHARPEHCARCLATHQANAWCPHSDCPAAVIDSLQSQNQRKLTLTFFAAHHRLPRGRFIRLGHGKGIVRCS